MRVLRRLLVALSFVGACAGAVAAQPPTCSGKNVLEELRTSDQAAHARVMAAAASENANAILWKVEKAGVAPSHLFGTMHLTDARINTLSPAVRQALAGARRLVLELEDISPGGFMKVMSQNPQMMGLMLFTDGRRLDQLLGPEDYRTITEVLSRSGVPPQMSGMFRPWLASLMLSVSGCEQRRMGAGLLPLDANLGRDAKARGIEVEGLETVEQQFRALAGVPEPDQVEMLKSGIRYYDRIDDMTETMIQLYLQRQLGSIWPLQLALAEKVGVPAKAFESAEKSLLVTRNLGMRDKALAFLEEGNAFIAVGGLHLPGRQGLVTLLREAGYTVTAVE
jgi:uncharacterized protein YbaP (TraB family)